MHGQNKFIEIIGNKFFLVPTKTHFTKLTKELT